MDYKQINNANQLMQHKELCAFVSYKLGIQSSKRRIQKKLLNKALQHTEYINELIAEYEEQGKSTLSIQTKEVDFSQLAVTTLLKTAKEHFDEEGVVKYYYNKNKPQYYKNKELLAERFADNFAKSDTVVQEKITSII